MKVSMEKTLIYLLHKYFLAEEQGAVDGTFKGFYTWLHERYGSVYNFTNEELKELSSLV